MARKTFSCGHKGKGQYCHRCAQESELHEQQIARKNDQLAWKNSFNNDPVDLRKLISTKRLVDKARKIIADIHNGRPYVRYRGKRLKFDRHIISVPLNRDWRLIFYESGGKIRCRELMSHEEYNVSKPGERVCY